MAKSRADRFNEGLISRRAKLMRHEGRKSPALPLRVELIRRRTDADASREVVLPSPRVCSVRVNANRKILHQGKMLSALGELYIELPLYPFIKADAAVVLTGKLLHFRISRMPVLAGPAMPARLLFLCKSTKDSKTMKIFTALTAEHVKCGIACEMKPECLKDAHLKHEHFVTINKAIGIQIVASTNSLLQMWNELSVSSRN